MRAAALLTVFLALAAGTAPAQQPLTGPAAGRAVAALEGDSQASYFARPLEWARFQSIMASMEFRDLRLATETSRGMVREGGHVVLTGCAALSCKETAGGLAVEIASGRPMAVLWRRGVGPEVWGETLARMPKTLRQLAETGRP